MDTSAIKNVCFTGLCVQVVQYWTDPVRGLVRIYKVLITWVLNQVLRR